MDEKKEKNNYPDSFYSVTELVIASKDELRSKLPFSGLSSLREVALEFDAMILIRLFEGFQDITGFSHFVNGFLNLPFKDFSWLKKGSCLQCK